jgi:hypothetical protein
LHLHFFIISSWSGDQLRRIIVRLNWAKALLVRVSDFNPSLKAGVMKAKLVAGFSPSGYDLSDNSGLKIEFSFSKAVGQAIDCGEPCLWWSPDHQISG